MEGDRAGTARRRWVVLAIVASVPLLTGASTLRTHQPPSDAAAASAPTPTPLVLASASPSPSASATPTESPGATVRAHPAAAHPPVAARSAGPAITVGVPWYHQQYNLSCEESSLSMVLAFYGHPTSEQQIFDRIGIDRVHYWAGKPGGGDPYVSVVGDPNGSEVQQTGYGVYWTPIGSAARSFGAPVAQAGEGIAPAVIYSAIRAGHPALVWVSYDMQPHARADYQAYDGRTIPYAGPWEHSMVVTGIDGNSVRLNDPDRGQYWVTFATFEAAYAVYNQMGVVFGGSATTPAPVPVPTATPIPTHIPTPDPTPMPTLAPTPTPTPASTPTPTPVPSPT